jgi:hypothetical protein
MNTATLTELKRYLDESLPGMCHLAPLSVLIPKCFYFGDAMCELLNSIEPNEVGKDPLGATIEMLLNTEDESLLMLAYTSLRLQGAEAVQKLTDVFWDENTKECAPKRWLAVTILGWLGPSAKQALPEIVSTLPFEKHWAIRAACAEAIGRIGFGSDPIARLALVKSVLLDKNRKVRHAAADAIGGDGGPRRRRRVGAQEVCWN